MNSLYIEVISAESFLPVTGVCLGIAGRTAVTDGYGRAFFRDLARGKHKITVSGASVDPCEVVLPEKTDVYTRIFLAATARESQKIPPEKSKSKKI